MKCAAIFLLACVAVSQAAFTANLVQQAQPLLNQALFKIRLASRASNAGQPLVDHLQEQANSILGQIQVSVANGQAVAQQTISAFQATVAQLHALGQDTFEVAQAHLQNLFGNIWGTIFGSQGKNLAGAVDFVQNLHLNLETYINGLFEQAQALVNSLNLPQLLQNAVSQIASQLGARNGILNIFTQLQNAGQQAVGNFQTLVQEATNLAGATWSNLVSLSQDFVTHAQTVVQTQVSQSATELANLIKPYQQALGNIYENVVSQLPFFVGAAPQSV